METKLLGEDLDFLAWGVCPECGESYHIIRYDDSHYGCECGWTFTVSDGEVFASNEAADETKFDVFA